MNQCANPGCQLEAKIDKPYCLHCGRTLAAHGMLPNCLPPKPRKAVSLPPVPFELVQIPLEGTVE